MRLPPRPDLQWKPDGTPMDAGVGDIYFSPEDGLAETRAVFLAGCRLPERFAERDTFTIAELGFGTGLNFLAAWQLWQRYRRPSRWLNFVSFEGFPLDRDDAARALAAWPELAVLADALITRWPQRAKGIQRLVWPQEQISLQLHIGDIAETLPASSFQADAWFLDGFSPALNGDMWNEALWPQLAARSAPGARLATFTVAGAVRRGLSAAGFTVTKAPGYGRKRQRLEGEWTQAEPRRQEAKAGLRVAVLGAGIAGASAAHALSARGARVSVFEQASELGAGTSGNPLALVMPRLDAGDTPEARLLIDAYLAARGTYAGMSAADTVDVVHRPRSDQEAQRCAKVLADPPLGLENLEALAGGGLLHKQALIIRPKAALQHLLAGSEVRLGSIAQVDLPVRTVNGEAFDIIILATGWHMQAAFPWLRLQGRAGQVDWLKHDVLAPPSALAAGHYALASGDIRLWGATFEAHEGGMPEISETARAHNLQALEDLAPYWWCEAKTGEILSRAGVRATTSDRLPLIGALPDSDTAIAALSGLRQGQHAEAEMPVMDGVYVAGGFGSRGFTWGPWAGGLLSALVFGDPVPASLTALDLINPGRQIRRDLRRGLI